MMHGNSKRQGWQVPAFGSWDSYEGVPFTQCFDSARRAESLRYEYCNEDRDLYVDDGLYESDEVAPAVIVVPRRRTEVHDPHAEIVKEKRWPNDLEGSPIPGFHFRARPKPVDEDLYKVPAELLHVKPRKKRGSAFFSSCLIPACALC
ncbi:uncharacterized protein LOC115690516 isoform X2 [Syzygium oleosum]|uniref:uncharacterized protein LOC115690516 isoform X2 n=1 Tax=Syzygium oleosum TaxID=219896 RepID=UPI0024BBAC6F|nr:uncharacterized protein LOC115690516 isoform X2 [Syzygium oleosum]